MKRKGDKVTRLLVNKRSAFVATMVGVFLISGAFYWLISEGVNNRDSEILGSELLEIQGVLDSHMARMHSYEKLRSSEIIVQSVNHMDEDSVEDAVNLMLYVKRHSGVDLLEMYGPEPLAELKTQLTSKIADSTYAVKARYTSGNTTLPTILLLDLGARDVFYDAAYYAVPMKTVTSMPRTRTTYEMWTLIEFWSDMYDGLGILICTGHWNFRPDGGPAHVETIVSSYISRLNPGSIQFKMELPTYEEERMPFGCSAVEPIWYVGNDGSFPQCPSPPGNGAGDWAETTMTIQASDDRFGNDNGNLIASADGRGSPWSTGFSVGAAKGGPSGGFYFSPPPADVTVGVTTDLANPSVITLLTRGTCGLLPPVKGYFATEQASLSFSARIEAGTDVSHQMGGVSYSYVLWPYWELAGPPPHWDPLYWEWDPDEQIVFTQNSELQYLRGDAIPNMGISSTASTPINEGAATQVDVQLTNPSTSDGVDFVDIEVSLDPASLGHVLKISGEQVKKVSLLQPGEQQTVSFSLVGWAAGIITPQIVVEYAQGAPVPSGLGDRTYRYNLPTIEVIHPTFPPVANAGPDINILEGDIAYLDGGFSTDPDGYIVTYEWDFDNDAVYDSTNPYAAHGWYDNGDFTVGLRVTDNDGLTDTDTVLMKVKNRNPVAEFTQSPTVVTGLTISTAAVAEDPGSDDLIFTWDWGDSTPPTTKIYYNDGSNPDPPMSSEGVHPFAAADSEQHTYADPGTYPICLTVEDDDGGETTICTSITVKRLPTVLSDPSDLITYSDSAILHSTLKDAEGLPLKNQASSPKTVYLEWRSGASWIVLDSDTLSSPTDDDYELEFAISIPTSFDPIGGVFNNDIRVRFDGDDIYSASNALGTLTIVRESILITVPTVYIVQTDTAQVEVTVRDDDNQILLHQGDEPKTFVLEYTLIGGEQTWDTIKAEPLVGDRVLFLFSLPQPGFDINVGTYSLRARFDGDTRYAPAVSPGRIVALSEVVVIRLPDTHPEAIVTYSDPGTMIVTILDDDDSPLINLDTEPKTFYLEATLDDVHWQLMDAKVLAGTQITFDIKVPENFDNGFGVPATGYTIRVRFDGDGRYLGSMSYGHLVVLRDTSIFSICPPYSLLGTTLTITAAIYDDESMPLLKQWEEPKTVYLDINSHTVGWRTLAQAVLENERWDLVEFSVVFDTEMLENREIREVYELRLRFDGSAWYLPVTSSPISVDASYVTRLSLAISTVNGLIADPDSNEAVETQLVQAMAHLQTALTEAMANQMAASFEDVKQALMDLEQAYGFASGYARFRESLAELNADLCRAVRDRTAVEITCAEDCGHGSDPNVIAAWNDYDTGRVRFYERDYTGINGAIEKFKQAFAKVDLLCPP